MIDLGKDIDSLSNFKRNTAKFLKRMKNSRRPVVLTVNGKAELVVQDAASYQRLLEFMDQFETIDDLTRGLEDVEQGRTKPIEKLKQEKQKKYGL